MPTKGKSRRRGKKSKAYFEKAIAQANEVLEELLSVQSPAEKELIELQKEFDEYQTDIDDIKKYLNYEIKKEDVQVHEEVIERYEGKLNEELADFEFVFKKRLDARKIIRTDHKEAYYELSSTLRQMDMFERDLEKYDERQAELDVEEAELKEQLAKEIAELEHQIAVQKQKIDDMIMDVAPVEEPSIDTTPSESQLVPKWKYATGHLADETKDNFEAVNEILDGINQQIEAFKENAAKWMNVIQEFQLENCQSKKRPGKSVADDRGYMYENEGGMVFETWPAYYQYYYEKPPPNTKCDNLRIVMDKIDQKAAQVLEMVETPTEDGMDNEEKYSKVDGAIKEMVALLNQHKEIQARTIANSKESEGIKDILLPKPREKKTERNAIRKRY